MCFFSGLTSPSMNLSAFSAVGSAGLACPVRKRPVRQTPVMPGVLAVLQPPLSSWVLLRNDAALWTTASHALASGPTFLASPAGARLTSKPPRAAARNHLLMERLPLLADRSFLMVPHGPGEANRIS